MQLKQLLLSGIPFILGILIGGLFTKNKSVMYLVIGFIISMSIFSVISAKLVRIKEATDKKMAIKNEGIQIINESIDYTVHGNEIGSKAFDKFFKNYILVFNLAIFIAAIISAIKQQWMWAVVFFIGVNITMFLTQIYRGVNNGHRV
jgi:hypothetical protein